MRTVAVIESDFTRNELISFDLQVFLDAKVIRPSSLEELKSTVNIDAVVLKGPASEWPMKEMDVIANSGTHVLILTDSSETPKSIRTIPADSTIKAIVGKLAGHFSVTAVEMAGIKTDEYFPVRPELVQLLVYSPEDLYFKKENNFKILFASQDLIDREKILKLEGSLFIKSISRAKFGNLVTHQIQNIGQELISDDISAEEKMGLVDSSMELISFHLTKSGLPPELNGLIESSIKTLMSVASKDAVFEDLRSLLLNDERSFRFAHAQLATYIFIHIVQSMDWLIEHQIEKLTWAVFFHDLGLLNDEEAKVHGSADLENKKDQFDDEAILRIKEHALLTFQMARQSKVDFPPGVDEVIKEHHGSLDGKGFNKDISDVSALSKMFMIAEEYVHWSLDPKEDFDEFIKRLDTNYVGEDYPEIIRSMFYLEKTTFEFLIEEQKEQEELGNTETVSDEIDIEMINVLVKGREEFNEEHFEIIKLCMKLTENKETISGSDFPAEVKLKLTGLTEIMKELNTLVKGGKPEEEQNTIIKGITSQISDAISVIKKKPEVLNQLMEPMTQNKGISPLMLFSKMGLVEEVRAIIKDKRELKVTDREGRNALHFAAMGKGIEVIKVLVEVGLSKSVTDSERRSPIYYSIACAENETFDYLLGLGSNLRQQTIGGMNLLMLAAFKGNKHAFSSLIAKGVDINTCDHNGKDVEYYAKKGNQEELTKLISKIRETIK